LNTKHAVFITHTVPVPLISGERIRTFHLVRELVRAGWFVSVFGLVPAEDPGPEALALLRELNVEVELRSFPAGALSHRVRLLVDVATKRPVHRDFFSNAPSVNAFHDWLRARDADVLVAGLYTFPYVPPDAHSRFVLDSHNAEARRIAAMATAGRSPRSWAAALQIEPVRRYEAAAARAARRVVAVSSLEQEYFEEIAPGKVDLVPNGVDCAALAPRRSVPKSRSLFFLGSMDYSANVDAVAHLIRNVLPHVRSQDVEVIIAGSNPRRVVHQTARQAPPHVRVDVAGFIPDTSPYFEACRAFVVPLRYGGGTRLKILEALARGVPVVSTSAGCEGLELEDGREIVVADDARDFAAALDRLLVDDELCFRLAEAGRRAVEARYDWSAIGRSFEATLSKVIS
jgi:polysaccharide biosynthesis protein PslH